MPDEAFEESRIVLHIDPEQTQDVLHELLEPMRSPAVDAELPAVGGGLPHAEFLGYIDLVKDTVEFAHFVAKQIIEWRRRRRELGKPVGVRLECGGLPVLSLDDSPDEEVMYYITVRRKQNETRVTAKRVRKRHVPHEERWTATVLGASLLLLTCGTLLVQLLVLRRRRDRNPGRF